MPGHFGNYWARRRFGIADDDGADQPDLEPAVQQLEGASDSYLSFTEWPKTSGANASFALTAHGGEMWERLADPHWGPLSRREFRSGFLRTDIVIFRAGRDPSPAPSPEPQIFLNREPKRLTRNAKASTLEFLGRARDNNNRRAALPIECGGAFACQRRAASVR